MPEYPIPVSSGFTIYRKSDCGLVEEEYVIM